MERGWFALGALFALLGVAAGAFAAHGLRDRISAESLVLFETAARYQIYHALALLAVSFAAANWGSGLVPIAGGLFLAGILLFSGSLYLLALTDIKILGAITPLGGVAFLAGWALLVVAALR